MAETRRSTKLHGLGIPKLVFTDVKLGKGADAVVEAVEWNGTLCAAKRLHGILLEDETPGGVEKLISNFEAECLTWSKLRHPGIVQLFGVYWERRPGVSMLVPTPVMEIMDTNLRKYVEEHSKEEFSLQQKTFVLRQVTQALTYLHSQNPPLVHHDLSPNNVLLNVASLVAKVSDFGMSRIINPSALTRKSSVKGTLAFMAPEALQPVPKYDTKLDVFSFGNVVIYILTHEWPQPQAPNKYEGGQLIALSELQRREHCIKSFTAQEKMLFLPIVEHCLAYLPDERPFSEKFMHELKQIESSLLKDGNTVAPFEQLRQQLSAKEEECRQKDEMIRNKNAELQRLQSEKEKGDRTTPGLEKQLVKEAETGLKPPVQPKPKLTLTLTTESLTVPPKTEAATVKKRTPPPVSPKPRHASFSGLPSPAGLAAPPANTDPPLEPPEKQQQQEGETVPAPKPKDPLPKGEGLNMVGDVLDMTPKKKSATCGRKRAWSTKEKRNTLQPDLPPPPPPPSAECTPAPKKYLMKVISLYQFVGTREDELSFPIGANIYVLKANDDGWYEGVMGKKRGWFPSNHVERVIE